jgi:hypothetical protein
MDGNLMLKILFGLAWIVSIWLDFRPEKERSNVYAAIAEAGERERHAWRYPGWAIRAIRFLLGVWLLWQAIRFILT